MPPPRPRLKTRPDSLGGEPQAGSVVAARYRLDKLLGKGGMGSVWAGWDTELEREVAVKFMATEIAERRELRERFTREAKAAAGLRTRHVVAVYDYGVDGHTPFIVMELLEGEDLRARLKRFRRLSTPEVAHIVAQAGKALQRAERAGVVHRDLKPANIFLAEVDDEEVVKVLDFGVAKTDRATPGSHATKTGVVLGSPPYMSPEQARGKKLDHRSDVWSLAAVAYRALTGKVAFTGDSDGDVIVKICTESPPAPSTHLPSLPVSLDVLFAKAFAADPNDRFQNAADLSKALARAVGAPPPAPSLPDRSGAHRAISASQPGADSGAWSPVDTPLSGAILPGGTPASGPSVPAGTPASSALLAGGTPASGPSGISLGAERERKSDSGSGSSLDGDAGGSGSGSGDAHAVVTAAEEQAEQEAPTVAIATPASGSLVLEGTPLVGTPRNTGMPASGQRVLLTPAGGSPVAAIPSSGAPSALTPQTWQSDEPTPPPARRYVWVVGGVCAAAVLLIALAASIRGGESTAAASSTGSATDARAESSVATAASPPTATATIAPDDSAPDDSATASAAASAMSTAAPSASAAPTATKTTRPAARHHPTAPPRPTAHSRPTARPAASAGPKKPSWGY